MSARPLRPSPAPLVLAVVSLLGLVGPPPGALAQPQAHHPGAWTPAEYWPGTGTTGVQAVHMALVRGDTLFGAPHSRVLAWGSWEPGRPQDGGLWSWNPTTDVGTAVLGNLVKGGLGPPEFNVFCGGHASVPSATAGDLLIFSGTDRVIAGIARSVRLQHQSGTWGAVATMNARRWYGVGTAMPWSQDGSWRVLATAGLMYDHMTVFGGRRPAGNTLTSDLERYQLTAAGGWDAPLAGSGPNWPAPREYHTLAEQGRGPHYLFGGKGAGDRLGDVWQLMRKDVRVDDTQQTYEWAQLSPVAANAQVGVPTPRWRHVAVVDAASFALPGGGSDSKKSTMYVYGGEDASGPRDDLWKLWWDSDPTQLKWKWSRLTPSGPSPGARSGATAVWDEAGNRLIVFGGESAAGALADHEVYVLDNPAASPTWRIAPRASGSGLPAARALHAMGADANRRLVPGRPDVSSNYWFHAMVFGGDLASGAAVTPSNEMWELFVAPGNDSVYWQARSPGGAAPAARTGASLVVYEGYPASAVVLGGQLAGGGADPGAWEIPLGAGSWAEQPSPGHSLHGQAALREREPVTALQPEAYHADSNTWRPWGPLKYQQSYHMLFAASDGGLWFPGPNFFGQEKTWRLDPATAQWTQPAVAGHGFGVAFDECATGVLYRPGKILKVGDLAAGTYRARALPVSASLDLGEPSLRWRLPPDTLALARQFHSVTVLPDGDVIASGGTELSYDDDGNPANDNPRQRPEIWAAEYVSNENRGRWYGARSGELQLAEEPVPRGHHSSAVLLPDGRLLSGGGHDTDPAAQIRSVDAYSPPYLYRANGAAALRPRLYGAQDHVAWGGTFEVACPDRVDAACLVRPGAATHTFNQDQRYVPLTLATSQPPAGGHRVLLNAPANAAEAPPGNYLLFVLRTDEVSGRLVPSIARWVNVGAAQTSYATWDTLPPAAVGDLRVVDITQATASLRWTAPADLGEGSAGRASRYELRYCVATQPPTLAEFLASGTRVADLPVPKAAGLQEDFNVTPLPALAGEQRLYFRLMSRDGSGSDRNWSAWSDQLEAQPGGGCPFVDTETDGGWREENSILGRSLTGTPALDPYRLRHAPAVRDGRVRLRVRENEQELTTLDQVRLVAIDHAPGLKAYALGERVVLGSRVPAARVTTSTGRDVTALVDGTGEGYAGEPGDTLVVAFAPHGAPAGAFGVTGVQNEHDPFLIDDGGGKGGGVPIVWRAPEELGASAVDAQVLRSTGIRIESRDAEGAWQPVGHRYPREHPDEAVYDAPGHGAVRLVFVGRHQLRFAGRLELAGEAFTAHKLPLLSARHTRLGDVAAAVDTLTGTPGNLVTELASGDTVSLEFGWPELAAGQVRELLLLSRGLYTANLPARAQEAAAPPPRFAFHGARPNPFAGRATLRFALPAPARVRLEVLDAQGRRVALLAEGDYPAGEHALPWDGRTAAGAQAGPGVYFYRLEAGEHRVKGKLSLVP